MCNRDTDGLCRSELSRLIFTLPHAQLAVVVASSTMVAAGHSLTDFRAASQTCSYLMQVCVSTGPEKQLRNLQCINYTAVHGILHNCGWFK